MFYAKSFALCKYLVNFMHIIAAFYAFCRFVIIDMVSSDR